MSSSWYEKQLSSNNYLSPIGFVLIIEKSKKVSYLCQRAAIPTFNVGSIDVFNQGRVPIPVIGNATFDNFTVDFIVDENLENYMEIHNWMRSISGAIDDSDYFEWKSDLRPSINDKEPRPSVSAGTLQVLNNNNLNNFDVVFKDMFPVTLSALPFDVTQTDNEFFTASVTFQYSYYEFRKPNRIKERL